MTDSRRLEFADGRGVRVRPGGIGTCATRHVLPFQANANGPWSDEPTATHAAADPHATPLNAPGAPVEVVGVAGIIAQVRLSHCMSRPTGSPWVLPGGGDTVTAAKQTLGVGQAIALTW